MKYIKYYESKSNDEFIGHQHSLFYRKLGIFEVSSLICETIFYIVINRNSTEIAFYCESGNNYCMYHDQDCCEYVRLYDIVGDLEDLIGNPILKSSEDVGDEPDNVGYGNDSYTWTFYNLATIKGYVTLRWLGESNGYYSESVNFIKISRNLNI